MSHSLLTSVVLLTLLQVAAPQITTTAAAAARSVDLIRGYGYEAEELQVVTEDGYHVTLTHMRSRDSRRPVLMVHGVLAGSDQWVIRGPGQDLAYSLVDSGHDVWLADMRGNTFSRGHVTFSVKDESYWNFSFHESGLYDVPAFIDTVLQRSGSDQLLYIGHSMGTTVYYIMCSLRPKYNQLIHTAVHLCPVAFRKPLSPLLTLLSNNVESIAESFRRGKTYEFFRRNRAFQDLGISICVNKEPLCRYLISQFYGETSSRNVTKLIGHASKVMSGTSVKNMLHLSQLYKSKNFTQFDYGKRRNYEIYGSKTPPSYPLERVTTPVALVYSGHDVFVDTQTVSRLAMHLPNVITKTYIPKFNHIDFLFSDDALSLVYKRIIKLFSSI